MHGEIFMINLLLFDSAIQNAFGGLEKIALRKFIRLALKNEIMLPKPGFIISL